MSTRVCKTCRVEKPLRTFYNGKHKDKLLFIKECRTCRRHDTCDIHGKYSNYGNSRTRCPRCKKWDDLLPRFQSIHGEYYNYDKSIFRAMNRKIIIACPRHG